MTDTTSPSGTVENAPTSFSLNEGVSAIESLLSDDLEGDLKSADVAKPAEAKTDATEEAEDDADLVLDDDETGDVAEPETEAPPAITDDYEIEVDGEKITLGQLKRNNLFQRDYSKKTEQLAQERQALQAESQKLRSEFENELRKRFEFIDQYANKFIPQKPVYDPADPIGYLEAQQAYEQQMGEWTQLQQLKEQELSQMTEKQQEQAKEWEAEQRNVLFTKVPALKTEDKRKKFLEDVPAVAFTHYGVTPEEFSNLKDGRYLAILHDAIQYRKAVAKSKEVKQQVVTKPKLNDKQRMNVQGAQVRDRLGRFEQLRKSGTIDDAARSIMDFVD